jgi:hypothetical protein
MTKRLHLFFSFALFVLAIGLRAEEVEMPGFAPRTPIAMGQGGSISSIATGYEALFSNPAGFDTPKREWTISPATIWINGDVGTFLVSSGLINAPSGYDGPTTTFGEATGYADYIESASEGGAGYGGSWGVGFVGKGLGLGLIGSTDLLLYGEPFPSGVQGYFLSDVSLVGGYTFVPVKGDFIRWSIGADIRPAIRFYAPLTAETFLSAVAAMKDDSLSGAAYTAALNRVDLYQGAGVALDAGTRLSMGDVTLSLVVRDILDTHYSMRKYGLGDWRDELKDDLKLPDSGEDPDANYVVPMSATVGLSYHPDLGAFARYLDPTIHAELDDPVGLFQFDSQIPNFLHFGLEVAVYRIWKLRFGLDRGSFTAGTGIRLWFVEFDLAGYTDAFGYDATAVPRSGLSLQLSFRF